MRFVLLLILLSPSPATDRPPVVEKIEFSTEERCKKEKDKLAALLQAQAIPHLLECVDTGSRVR